jgi:SRSO17 transposase
MAMEGNFETRCEELLEQAQVSAADWDGVTARLVEFVAPFVGVLTEAAQRRHFAEYAAGLLSTLDRKTGEGIAYLHGQDRKQMQQFVGESPWEHAPVLIELARQVGRQIGEAEGVIVFDPSAFAKKRTKSVGVARQWSGRQGKVDNCQVGISMGYVSRQEHALVNTRLYLPKEWTKNRKRCRAAGVPDEVKFQTRHELALAMLEESGPLLPHGWVAGDDEMGRCGPFRAALRSRGERYLLAVPSNTLIRDAEVPPPEYSGRGRHPKVPWQRVDRWCAALPESAWTALDVRDGEKGPLVIDVTIRRVQARTPQGGTGPDEVLFITRECQSDGSLKHDYYLSNAAASTPVLEFARVAKAEHRIEECFQRGKSEAGLGDYQVRNWRGWHHHQTLSLIAAWFLNEQTRRGKNPDSRDDRPASPPSDRGPHRTPTPIEHADSRRRYRPALAATQRTRPRGTLSST